jgi:hypothetical protein
MASAYSSIPHVGLDKANVAHDDYVSHDTINTNMAGTEPNESATETERDASDLRQRCQLLLDELEQLQLYLKQQKKENSVELKSFKNLVQAEVKLLDRVGIVLLIVDTC